MAKYCPIACKNEPRLLEKSGTGAGCKDLHPRCPIWKDLGECQENPRDMKRYCRLSCGVCGEKSDVDEANLCSDTDEQCAYWASKGECKANPNYMHKNCAKSCDTCDKPKKATAASDSATKAEHADESKLTRPQKLLLDWSESVGVRQSAIGAEAMATLARIKASKFYWEQEATEALPVDLLDRCRNQNALCSFWAHLGELFATQELGQCDSKAYLTVTPSSNLT